MDFTIKQPAFLKELEHLQGVVERKNTVPILAHVLLAADAEGLELAATDLEVSMRGRAAAEVRAPGAVCLSAKKIYEIIRLLPDADVTLKDDGDHRVAVACERSRFRIMGLGREDFPTLPAPGKTSKVRLPGALLRGMIEKIIFAVTSDDSRFALNGALMVLKDRSITLVASDGHRLAHVSETVEGRAGGEEERVLIPRKALAEVAKLLAGGSQDLFYCRRDNHLFFEVGTTQLTSRVLEGTFPNYEKVIPNSNDKVVEFGRGELTTILARVSVLANERSRAVRVALREGEAEISSRNPEVGDAVDVVPVPYRGPEIEVGFNARYLLDFLGAVGSERVSLELKDEQTQGLLRPVGDGAAGYTYVVMPMRL